MNPSIPNEAPASGNEEFEKKLRVALSQAIIDNDYEKFLAEFTHFEPGQRRRAERIVHELKRVTAEHPSLSAVDKARVVLAQLTGRPLG